MYLLNGTFHGWKDVLSTDFINEVRPFEYLHDCLVDAAERNFDAGIADTINQ